MASPSSGDCLNGALALAATLPPPASLDYSVLSAALPPSASMLPASVLPFSPLAHSLARMAASTKPLRTPSPLRSTGAQERLRAAREFALAFADEVVEAAVQHLVDVHAAMVAIGERLRLPLPMPAPLGSGGSGEGDRLHQMVRLSGKAFAAVIPGDSVAELVVTQSIFNFLNIYNTVLIVRIILTWFPNAPSAIVTPLSTVCDPYLNLFRGIIPPLGGTLDFSPILAFVVLNVFTNASAALPAEMPDGDAPRRVPVRRRPLKKLLAQKREVFPMHLW